MIQKRNFETAKKKHKKNLRNKNNVHTFAQTKKTKK